MEKHNRLNPNQEIRQGNTSASIESYIARIENIFLNPDIKTRQRNINLLRESIHDALIIKKENVPESYFELQKQIARNQGHGEIEITQEMRDRMVEVIIQDQKASLDAWIDYLTSEDAVYPAWFKYFAFKNVIKLSQFDKALGKFKDRTETTVAPFPDIFREPLAQLCDRYEKYLDDPKLKNDADYKTFVEKKFATIYAELVQKSLEASLDRSDSIKGEWKKYEQGNGKHAEELYESLQGKGTGWCTAGDSTARAQVESGDFYVYYTYDSEGKPNYPRVAIRMNGQNKIAEIRGVNGGQELEPQFADVVDNKMNEFGEDEAKVYKKKSQDMKLLTALTERQAEAEKNNMQAEFTKEEIRFIYELDGEIKGFGYKTDPRIKGLMDKRNYFTDMKSVVINKATLELLDKLEKENSPIRLAPGASDGAYTVQMKPITYEQSLVNFQSVGGTFGEFIEMHDDERNLLDEAKSVANHNVYTSQDIKDLSVFCIKFDRAPYKLEKLLEWLGKNNFRMASYEEFLELSTYKLKNKYSLECSTLSTETIGDRVVFARKRWNFLADGEITEEEGLGTRTYIDPETILMVVPITQVS